MLLRVKDLIKISTRCYGVAISFLALLVFLVLRVSSKKYSLDTAHLIDVFSNFFASGSLYSNIAGMHRFNLHFSPILAIIAPISLLGPSLLIFLWKFLCYGSFLYLFWRMLAKDERINWSEKQLFLLILVFHPTFFLNAIEPNLWDSDLTLPFLGLSFLAITQQRYTLAIVWFSVTYLVKEDMPLVGVLFGVFIMAYTSKLKYAWFSIFSLIYFLVVTMLVMPSFAAHDKPIELMTQNYSYLGKSFYDIVLNIIKDPSIILASGFWLRKSVSLLIIFACVAFLPVLRGRAILYLIPGMAILGYATLSNEPFLDYSKHYMLVFFVFVIAAAYHSYASLHECKPRRVVALVSVALSLSIIVSHIVFRSWTYYLYPIDNFSSMQMALLEVPVEKSLLTHGVASPWVGFGRRFQLSANFDPSEIERKRYDYILINKRTVFWEVLSDDANILLKENLMSLNKNERYETVFDSEDVILLERIMGHTKNGKQTNWVYDLEEFQNINQVSMKLDWIKILRHL